MKTKRILLAFFGMVVFFSYADCVSAYYSPEMGRFISRDPIGYDAGDKNLYRYVGNRPNNVGDPSGLMTSIAPPSTAPPTSSASYRELKDRTAGCCDDKIVRKTITVGWNDIPERKTFLENLEGTGTLLMAENVNDILVKLNNNISKCECIKILTINSHGGGMGEDGFRMTEDLDDMPNRITGERNARAFGGALKGIMCQPCYINIMSCNAFEGVLKNGVTLQILAKETGCTVRGTIGFFGRYRFGKWEALDGIMECDPFGKCQQIHGPNTTGTGIWYEE